MMTAPFKLSRTLEGHSQDVRALVCINESTFASASRDTSVIVWKRLDNNNYQQVSIFSKHSHFVNCLAYLPPSNIHPSGLLISSGSDKVIYAYNPFDTDSIAWKLEGHKENVCALTVGTDGKLISGSWDRTAKIWNEGKLVKTLEGHEAAVWGVLALDDEKVVTASADKTIKIWTNGTLTATLKGHQDVVRSLVLIPGLGFASCSNDSSIRIWSIDGQNLSELHGHTSFVYSLGRIPSSGEIISGGEDRCLRVWSGPEQIQSITQPCVSVWSVLGLQNGDIIAAGSDAHIRIFSRSVERHAADEDIAAFESLVSASSIPSNQVGDLNKQNLEGTEALAFPGRKEGEVKMIRVGNIVEAHQWSGASLTWQKIGEVVDAIGGGRKKMFGGKEYDYVFDVDIEDGAPPLKLPYNNGDNPYQAAQIFIETNDLPQSYLEEIANFVIKNAQVVTLGEQTLPATNLDPYTGGSRYVPGASSQVPVSAQPKQQLPSISKLIPNSQFIFFKAANVPAIKTKLLQLNQQMDPVLRMSESETKTLDSLESKLTSDLALDSQDWELLQKIALQWGESFAFPGIDLVRLSLLSRGATSYINEGFLEKIWSRFIDSALNGDCAELTKIQETNLLLSIRAICNAFSKPECFEVLSGQKDEFINGLAGIWRKCRNKNVILATLTLCMNLVVLVKNAYSAHSFLLTALEWLIRVLEESSSDDEIILRTLVIIGTIFLNEPSVKSDRYTTNKLGGILSYLSKRDNMNNDLHLLVLHIQSLDS